MSNDIKAIGIIGEGKMGTNLFYYLLEFDFSITWVCSREADTEKISKSFNRKLKRSLDAGVMDETSFSFRQENTLITNDLQQVHRCDLIIETISENLAQKRELFGQLDEIAGEHCIFASNSSSFKPSELLASASRRDKMAGLHFFYPVALNNMVELIVTGFTSVDTIRKINHFLQIIHRVPLMLKEEHSFILNKVFLDFQNEAYLIVKEGAITVQQMDALIKKHLFPLGVFDFCDSVGNDIMLTSAGNYIKDTPDRDHYQLFIHELDRLVKENKLGVKNGSGFYDYPIADQPEDILAGLNHDQIETSVRRLQSTLASSIIRFSSLSGIDPAILNNTMKEYLGTEKDLVTFPEK
jgi:3-hydroxyacyl-CoA dehydrogenase